MLSLVNAGINNVVAPLGTAFTTSQAQLLRRYNARIMVCFDGDSAGRKAGRRVIEILPGSRDRAAGRAAARRH